MGQVDFQRINQAALAAGLAGLLKRWLPDSQIIGQELVAKNPTRADRHLGSFKINLASGRWSDFATGDRGGDPTSLIAYLDNCGQVEAARRLAEALGIPAEG